MDKFLQQVAAYFYQNHKLNFADFKLVFPNRRAGLFFQKYLSELIDSPVFSPEIITITELVQNNSGLQLIDQNRLVIELYNVFSKITRSDESLDEFFFWGEMMLTDFNDIDKYRVDASQLFSNIKSLREIDAGFDFLSDEQKKYISTFWNSLLLSRNSESKNKFVSIWSNLLEIYNEFRKGLLDKNFAYEGLLYRSMVEQLNAGAVDTNNKQLCFIGFNALNRCEELIFKHFAQNKSALFFWDYDSYYVEAQKHEAGLFMVNNLRNFPMPSDFLFDCNNFIKLKEIDVVAVPSFSGQAGYTAEWISNNANVLNNRFDNTAIVLCDETLLNPLLSVLPSNIETFNITMGYPVKSSPVFALLKGLIDIDRNARTDKNGTTLFYYRNVLALLSSPLIKTQLGDFVEHLLEDVKTNNKIYLSLNDFNSIPLLGHIFNLPVNAVDCHVYLQKIIQMVFAGVSNDHKLISESLYQTYQAINRLAVSLFVNTNGEDATVPSISKKLFYQLLIRQLERLNIPFEGEPLSGTQIMGFLETRCLDFDNLILLSFNDDKLPGNSHRHSFIPYSLRRGFGLPTVEQQNAMYAYYFYRLMQRAKNVCLVYDSRTEGITKGEVSRYATQIKYEATHLTLRQQQAVFDFEPIEQQAIIIEKVPALIEKIEQHLLGKRISPSALNVYVECSLKFFFKYIEGISELDDVAEDIDHLLFGRIAHVALELLYEKYVGKVLTVEIIDGLLTDTRQLNLCLQKALEKEFFKGNSMNLNGRNLLVFEIIKRYVLRILKYDKSIAPFKLIGLEVDYEQVLEVEVSGNKNLKVRVGGTVDRIDQIGDRIRVVDYKTGKADVNVKSIESLFIDNANRNKAAFQTMLYAGCVVQTLKPVEPVLPAVYGARGVFKDDFDPLFTINNSPLIYQANASEYVDFLKQMLAEIIDSTVAFVQTTDDKKCSYCSFNGICRR